MAGLRIKVRDLAKTKLDLPTGKKHEIVVIRPSLFVLDVEDAHFNFDRRVVLPDLATTDGSTPVLDTRRVTGLGVIFAALTHAKAHASQGLCVTGHTDASGGAAYNQKLSEARAKNVSLLLRGKRDDWSRQAASEDNVDDVQAVLKWQSERAGWDCDPGDVDDKLGPRTREAIGEFQKRYNDEVERAQHSGADSPFRAKITVDEKVGKETWGAIYDLYLTELMDLFDTDKVSDVETLQARIKVPPGMNEFVGCGEHIPFNPARRDPFEKGTDEHLEGPQKNPPDRRVEILFFDPGEEVPQVCHPKPGACDPTKCPIYILTPFREKPIGIPKGLPVTEVNLKLSFRDPEGKVRPFPEGLEIEAKFGDPKDDPGDGTLLTGDGDSTDAPAGDGGDPPPTDDPSQADPDAESMAVDQEPNEKTQAGGLLQFVIPRKASSLYLRFLPGTERCFITADPQKLDDQKLATADDALAGVGDGRVFFKLPPEFNSQQGYFADLSTPVTFKDGRFLDVDNRETEIGSRESPLELILEIHWQHFKFEYFDRWTSSLTTVPQPRSKDAAGKPVPALVLDGYSFLPDANLNPSPMTSTAWDVKSGKDTVHCLAWVQGFPDNSASPPAKRALPDDQCTARFATTDLFVRTDGDGSAPDGPRTFVTVAPDDALRTTPSVDRLRLYDVPSEWRSTDYPVRMDGDGKDKIQPFKGLAAAKTSVDKAFVVSLDTIILDDVVNNDKAPSPPLDDGAVGHVENRIAIYDNQLNVYKPDTAGKEPYFTRVKDLSPQPLSPVLLDFPPFTRFITRGTTVYDVFQDRSCDVRAELPKGFPLGARLAKQPPGGEPPFGASQKLFYILDPAYSSTKPNGTQGVFGTFKGGALGILRCCGHLNGKIEQFMIFEYMAVNFDFQAVPKDKNEAALKNPPSGAAADAKVADCLVKVAARWNATPVDFHVGNPETAHGRWRYLLARGQRSAGTDPVPFEVRINIFGQRRASQGGQVGNWQLSDMDVVPVSSFPTSFTAAHELGHAMSLPDEYLNTDDEPSCFLPNFGEAARSPGQPFGFDKAGMMVEGQEFPRAHSFWHIGLFAREQGYFTDASQIMVQHGPNKLTTDLTPRSQNRVQFPVTQALNVEVPPALGTGFCDQFVYVMGADEVGGGVLGGSSPGNPYDGFICIRVKMQWHFDSTTDLDDMADMMRRADAIVTSQFNVRQHLVARGTFQGKPVRLRYLFCPRYNLHTFPASGAAQSSYLDGLKPPLAKKDKPTYEAAADTNATKNGVHAIIHVTSRSGTPGVTSTASSPRQALIRESGFLSPRFDSDFALVFAQLLGLNNASFSAPTDFKALADQLPGVISGVRLSFE